MLSLLGMKPVVLCPLALGSIHGRIGVLDQRFGILSVAWIQTDADTRSDGDLVPAEGQGI
jgi:hypothetical protein